MIFRAVVYTLVLTVTVKVLLHLAYMASTSPCLEGQVVLQQESQLEFEIKRYEAIMSKGTTAKILAET